MLNCFDKAKNLGDTKRMTKDTIRLRLPTVWIVGVLMLSLVILSPVRGMETNAFALTIESKAKPPSPTPVSYTHLTLPTIYSV